MKTYKISIIFISTLSIIWGCSFRNFNNEINKNHIKDSCLITVSFKEKNYFFNSKADKDVIILIKNISDTCIQIPELIRQYYFNSEFTDINFEVKKLHYGKYKKIDFRKENVLINQGLDANNPKYLFLNPQEKKEFIHNIDRFYNLSYKGHYKVRAIFKASKYFNCIDITTEWVDVYVK